MERNTAGPFLNREHCVKTHNDSQQWTRCCCTLPTSVIISGRSRTRVKINIPESGRSRICVCRHRSPAARLNDFCVFFPPLMWRVAIWAPEGVSRVPYFISIRWNNIDLWWWSLARWHLAGAKRLIGFCLPPSSPSVSSGEGSRSAAVTGPGRAWGPGR